MRLANGPVLLCLAALVAACGLVMPGNGELERAVLAAEPGEGVAILDRVGIEGDKLCVVGPYTGREAFREVTAVDWPEIEHTSIPMSDLIDLVAVIRDDRVVAWAEVVRGTAPRSVGAENGCAT